MHAVASASRLKGQTIVLVPTMGFLHEGHLSLVRQGRKLGNQLIVSIFVNPTQFGPNEDFEDYPRDFNRDVQMVAQENADIVFAPEAADIYPANFQTFVNTTNLSNKLCGLSRPSHFKGVTTVVAKLFNIVQPHIAIFGKKDFQQLIIIRQMVCDLNFDIKIIGAATVRESDGLAMSSRNTYLSQRQRSSAPALYQALLNAQKMVNANIKKTSTLIQKTTQFIEARPETQIDYIAICDPRTLEDLKLVKQPALMALAVKIGRTRLIDNMILTP